MSTRFSNNSPGFGDGSALLAANAIQIALNFLERAGEIDDYTERHGQRNRLVLANRAIAAFQRYRTARTIEQWLV
jgi:hypothetical protein